MQKNVTFHVLSKEKSDAIFLIFFFDAGNIDLLKLSICWLNDSIIILCAQKQQQFLTPARTD